MDSTNLCSQSGSTPLWPGVLTYTLKFGAVDDAEQALVIARHLPPLIERQPKAAGNAEARAELLRNLLEVLGDVDVQQEALYRDEPAKIRRLDAVRTKALGALPLPRPVTPLSDAALMTNARKEPTLAAELRAELASADHVGLLCASNPGRFSHPTEEVELQPHLLNGHRGMVLRNP